MDPEAGDRSRDLGAALRRLRAAYRRTLPDRLRELAAAMDDARGEGGSQALRTAQRLAHTLRGTAGSYGFAEVSQGLEAVEESLESLLEGSPGEATPLWGRAQAALDGIRAGLEDGGPADPDGSGRREPDS